MLNKVILTKKLFNYLLMIFSLELASSLSYAFTLSSSDFESSCKVNVEKFLYFPNSSTKVTGWTSVSFSTQKLSQIVPDNTAVSYWQGNGGSLEENCSSIANWSRGSNVSPGNNASVVAFINNTCTYTRNNNPSLPFAQFIYQVGYKEVTGYFVPEQLTELPGGYNYYPENGTKNVKIPDQRKRTWSNELVDSKACVAFYARWCGDGIVSDGEVCDEGKMNGQPKHCSSDCKIAP
jgi:hypothetical protein